MEMGLATITFTVHTDNQGRYVADVYVPIRSNALPMPIDVFSFIRHDDILRNMGLTGRKFIDQNKQQVLEMKRTFLEFMKATRLEPADQADIDANQEPEVRINEKGYPIIPKEVMNQQFPKAKCEKMMRAFMNRHYCEWPH